MITCVPCFCSHSHRSRSEVLNLFQMEVKPFGYNSQFCHILGRTSGVTAYEVWYNLLAQVMLRIYAVEYLLESFKLLKRRFAHDVKHFVACVFRCYLQSSAHVFNYQLAGVFLSAFVYSLVFAFVQKQVVSHTAANKALFDSWKCIYGMIDVQQWSVVCIQIGAYLGMNARRTFEPAAHTIVLSPHGIHVGRRASKVAQITLEIWHFCYSFHLLQDTILASAYDEFTLVG